MPLEAPKTMTRQRKLVGVRKDGTSAYYHDLKDHYIYQLLLPSMTWNGWLCTLQIWEETFSKSEVYRAA